MNEPGTQESVIIRPAEIVSGPMETKLGSVDAVTAHLQVRSAFFCSRLADMSNNPKYEWTKISLDGGNKVVKTHVPASADALFTGELLCRFASCALQEGISLVSGENVVVDVVEIFTDLNAEEWGKPGNRYGSWGHVIVMVTQKDTGQKMFYDATYGQVDHRLAGRIIAIPEDDLIKFYKSGKGDPDPTLIWPCLKEERGIKMAEQHGISKQDYHELVGTLL